MMHVFLLLFTICGPAAGIDTCEDGQVLARSCAAAEAWLRAGLREDQTLHLGACEVAA